MSISARHHGRIFLCFRLTFCLMGDPFNSDSLSKTPLHQWVTKYCPVAFQECLAVTRFRSTVDNKLFSKCTNTKSILWRCCYKWRLPDCSHWNRTDQQVQSTHWRYSCKQPPKILQDWGFVTTAVIFNYSLSVLSNQTVVASYHKKLLVNLQK